MSAVVLIAAFTAADAMAGCNIIPSAARTFRGALGSANKPFAGPGDFVEVRVEPARCDATSPGLGAAGEDHVVTVVFTPTGSPARVVFLTAESCAGGKAKALRESCESTAGVGNVACVQAFRNDLVTVRLDDGDTQPINQRTLLPLAPVGKSGKLWRYKAKAGLRQVQLKSLAPKQPGLYQLVISAKAWFSAKDADDSAANTRVTVTVGGQCLTHAVTKKTD